MKVFVTGASGLIGSRIVQQLVAANHTVTGLARSDSSVEKVKSLGASPVRGSHTDLDVIRKAASDADAVIHCAFNHAIMGQNPPHGFLQASEEDRGAIAAMCDALVGTNKTFINSSGLAGNDGEDETSEKEPGPLSVRGQAEKLVASYSSKGVKGINIRLAPIVHSDDSEHPFITGLSAIAKQHGFSGYVDDGNSLWAATHAWDAAALYVLSLTADAVKPGSNLHGAFELNIPTKEFAEYVGKKLKLETKSVPSAQAAEHFGFLAMLLQSRQSVSNKLTLEWTGWKPSGKPTLWEDLDTYAF